MARIVRIGGPGAIGTRSVPNDSGQPEKRLARMVPTKTNTFDPIRHPAPWDQLLEALDPVVAVPCDPALAQLTAIVGLHPRHATLCCAVAPDPLRPLWDLLLESAPATIWLNRVAKDLLRSLRVDWPSVLPFLCRVVAAPDGGPQETRGDRPGLAAVGECLRDCMQVALDSADVRLALQCIAVGQYACWALRGSTYGQPAAPAPAADAPAAARPRGTLGFAAPTAAQHARQAYVGFARSYLLWMFGTRAPPPGQAIQTVLEALTSSLHEELQAFGGVHCEILRGCPKGLRRLVAGYLAIANDVHTQGITAGQPAVPPGPVHEWVCAVALEALHLPLPVLRARHGSLVDWVAAPALLLDPAICPDAPGTGRQLAPILSEYPALIASLPTQTQMSPAPLSQDKDGDWSTAPASQVASAIPREASALVSHLATLVHPGQVHQPDVVQGIGSLQCPRDVEAWEAEDLLSTWVTALSCWFQAAAADPGHPAHAADWSLSPASDLVALHAVLLHQFVSVCLIGVPAGAFIGATGHAVMGLGPGSQDACVFSTQVVSIAVLSLCCVDDTLIPTLTPLMPTTVGDPCPVVSQAVGISTRISSHLLSVRKPHEASVHFGAPCLVAAVLMSAIAWAPRLILVRAAHDSAGSLLLAQACVRPSA
eukprot:gene12563-350_t